MHPYASLVEVDVVPAQPQCLAAPESCRREQPPKRAVPTPRRDREEMRDLLSCPGPSMCSLTRPSPGRIREVRGVADDQVPAHCVSERPVQDHVHVGDRSR
jgi:hypothetical protein